MEFTSIYHTPREFDDLLLVSDGKALTGIFFKGSKDAAKVLAAHPLPPCTPHDAPTPRTPCTPHETITLGTPHAAPTQRSPCTPRETITLGTPHAAPTQRSPRTPRETITLGTPHAAPTPRTPCTPRETITPCTPRDAPFTSACQWLDLYFSGHTPSFVPAWSTPNLTHFQHEVQSALRAIPWGQTRTYGDIAAEIARARGIPKMSAQAVGQAVGANPLCILIPCHRVIGANGTLTGYGGGLENKKALLRLEGIFL